MRRESTLTALRDKVFEAVERTEHLIALTPEEKVRWTPVVETSSAWPMSLGDLLGHLVDCVAGFCAVFSAAFPEEFGNPSELCPLKANQVCEPQEAREGIARMRAPIARGFALCRDEDLARKIGTVFVAEGEMIGRLPTTTHPSRKNARAVVSPTPPVHVPGSCSASICANRLCDPSGATSTMVVPVPCRFELLLKLLIRMCPCVRFPTVRVTRGTP